VRTLFLILMLSPSLVLAQGMPIKSGATSDLLTVNTSKAALIIDGPSTKATYGVSSSALVTTAAYTLSIMAGASNAFRLASLCVGITNATAAAGITVTLQKRSTATTGGTALTNEGTGADSIAKFDAADGNFAGTAIRTGTLGTIGPMLGQWGFMVGELAAGTADVPGPAIWCYQYGLAGTKLPTVAAGTANALVISVSSAGAGGLAFGSIYATIIQD
jgi:hypothetical protein